MTKHHPKGLIVLFFTEMWVWFGAIAAGSYGSGLLGRSYGLFAHHEYYLVIAGLLFFSSGLVFLFLMKLNRFSQ